MELLASLIWTCALGLAVGNYATSFIFRTPRDESPFTKHPYCGGCGTMLAVKDLFPAVSWLMLKGKCRYCAMPIPAVYLWTEIFCALIFMLGVASYGFNEPYMLVAAGGTVAVTLWGLEVRTGRIYFQFLLLLGAIGLVYRTLLDGTLYDALYGMVWGAAIPLILWRMRIDPANLNGEKERLHIPPTVALGATAGIWLAPFGLMVFVLFWAIFAFIYRLTARYLMNWPGHLLSASYCFSLVLLLLWPQIVDALKTWLISIFLNI